METEPNIETILNDIKYYVTRKVDNFQSNINCLNKDVEKYLIFKEWLADELESSKDNIEYFKDNGLNANALEFEGFRRCLIEIDTVIKGIDDDLD